MTKQIGKILVTMALVTGCGEAGLTGVGGDANEAATSEQGMAVDLRMRGTGAAAFERLLLLADDVQVSADGVPLNVSLAKDSLVDLSMMDHAAKLATVRIPEGAQQLEFTVFIAPAGEYVEANGSGFVDASSTVLRFVAPVGNVVANGKAVIAFDAAKSIVDQAGGDVMLVPNYRIVY